MAPTLEPRCVKRKSTLRVLAVIPGDGLGSSMIFARRQVRSLQDRGLEVEIYRLGLATSPTNILNGLLKLRRAIYQFRPQIVHAHYGTVTSLLCILSTRLPLVVTLRGSDLNRHPEVSWIRYAIGHLLSQLAALRAKKAICVSSQLRNRLWSKHAAVILPSGVDLQLFVPCPREHARAMLHWDNAPTVLFSGGKDPYAKGLPLVRDAIALVHEVGMSVRLIVLDGTVPPEVIPTYLNAADCLVLASEREGSPNIVKEAMACNLPVVAVDVGDVAERLRGVEPSRIVARSATAMAWAVTEILSSGRRSNGRAALAECSEEYVAERLEVLYREVVEAPAQRVLLDSSPGSAECDVI